MAFVLVKQLQDDVVTNNGISDATGVKVTDTVKGSGEIVSCVDQTGKSYSGSEWIIDSVAAGPDRSRGAGSGDRDRHRVHRQKEKEKIIAISLPS